MTASRSLPGALAAVFATVAAGCGGSGGGSPATTGPEHNPSGDIPDTQAYVPFTAPGGGYVIRVPEGWSRSAAGATVSFTDKLNHIRVESASGALAPTVASARRVDVPGLARTVPGFRLTGVTTVRRPAGTAVRITYRVTGAPDQVTGKRARDAAERYVYFHRGRQVIVTLSGPVGADNVDPWRIITSSLRWTS